MMYYFLHDTHHIRTVYVLVHEVQKGGCSRHEPLQSNFIDFCEKKRSV